MIFCKIKRQPSKLLSQLKNVIRYNLFFTKHMKGNTLKTNSRISSCDFCNIKIHGLMRQSSKLLPHLKKAPTGRNCWTRSLTRTGTTRGCPAPAIPALPPQLPQHGLLPQQPQQPLKPPQLRLIQEAQTMRGRQQQCKCLFLRSVIWYWSGIRWCNSAICYLMQLLRLKNIGYSRQQINWTEVGTSCIYFLLLKNGSLLVQNKAKVV